LTHDVTHPTKLPSRSPTNRFLRTFLCSSCASSTSDRLAKLATESEAEGRTVSAREAWFGASTYYHVSYFPLYGFPVDPLLTKSFEFEVDAFQRAAALSDPASEPVEIPFEGRTLPGYFLRASNDNKPRPTILQTHGYDGDIPTHYMSQDADPFHQFRRQRRPLRIPGAQSLSPTRLRLARRYPSQALT
jgi:hypothetical protein